MNFIQIPHKIMKILCKLNNNGRIIAACEKGFPQPGWLEINVPDDFSIHNATYYSVVNGDIIFSNIVDKII